MGRPLTGEGGGGGWRRSYKWQFMVLDMRIYHLVDY